MHVRLHKKARHPISSLSFVLQLSFIDLSPDHAGTLYSVANSLSCVFLIASPYFTGMMIEEEVSHKVTNLLHYPYYRVTGDWERPLKPPGY